jgi:hypothetical protein
MHGKIFLKIKHYIGSVPRVPFFQKKSGPSGIKHLFTNATLLGKKPEG